MKPTKEEREGEHLCKFTIWIVRRSWKKEIGKVSRGKNLGIHKKENEVLNINHGQNKMRAQNKIFTWKIKEHAIIDPKNTHKCEVIEVLPEWRLAFFPEVSPRSEE